MNKGLLSLVLLAFSCVVFAAIPAAAAPTRFGSPNFFIESPFMGLGVVLHDTAASIPPVITKGPTVSGITTSSALISWTTDKDANSVVLAGTKPGDYPIQTGQIADTIYTGHAVTLNNLDKGKAYYFVVRSSDVAGNLVQSPEASFSTDPGDVTPPAVVAGPAVTNNSATSVRVTWITDEAANGVVEYGIKAVDENSIGQFDDLSLNHQVDINNLASSQKYLMRIKSKDALGNLYVGPTQEMTTLNAPSITNVKISDITLNSALIQWQTNSPSTSLVGYGAQSQKYDQNFTDPAFTENHLVRLSGLQNGTVYYFRINGQDQTGNRLGSDEYVFRTVILPTIVGVSVAKVAADSATVTWNSSSDIDELLQYEVTASSLDPSLVGKRLAGGTDKLVSQHAYQLSDLPSSSSFRLVITGKDVFGNQAVSQPVVFTTPPDTIPPVIQNVKSDTSINLGSKSTVQVLVSFGLSKPGIARIEYGSGSTGGTYEHTVTTDTDLGVSKLLVIPGLVPGQSYHYRIVATDRVGNKAASDDFLVLAPVQQQSLFDLIFSEIGKKFGSLVPGN